MNHIPDKLFKDKDKFLSKIKVVASGCWEWQGRLNQAGYGELGRHTRAHRVSYALHKSDPQGLCVLHKCDNPPCVNPEHLFLGTRKDNNQDRVKKGRSFKPKPFEFSRKINKEILNIMIEMYQVQKLSLREIGRQFKLDKSHISDLLKKSGVVIVRDPRKVRKPK